MRTQPHELRTASSKAGRGTDRPPGERLKSYFGDTLALVLRSCIVLVLRLSMHGVRTFSESIFLEDDMAKKAKKAKKTAKAATKKVTKKTTKKKK